MKTLPASIRVALTGLIAIALGGCGRESEAPLAGNAPEASAEDLPIAPLRDAPSVFVRRFADSPVRWQEWSAATFELAASLGRPVFVYLGYSACPWCEKMRRESLETPRVTRTLNTRFVPVLADAEVLPALNTSLIRYVNASTRRAGWPLCVALTPDGMPLSAFGYMPPPGTRDVPTLDTALDHIADQWEAFPDFYGTQAARDFAEFQKRVMPSPVPSGWTFSPELVGEAFTRLASGFDPSHGGLSGYPKFPVAAKLEFLTWLAGSEEHASPYQRERAASMVRTTLEAMAASALYDHVGGGFFRYSTDTSWNAPNFEKMLADQAVLARLYVHASQVLDEPRFAGLARQLFAFADTAFALPGGGYATSLDTGGGPDGKPTGWFYLWSSEEIDGALETADRELFTRASEIRARGNIPSADTYAEPPTLGNLPRLTELAEATETLGLSPVAAAESIDRALSALKEARDARTPPRRDDKVILSDNALMLSALATAARQLDDPALGEKASALADFLLASFYDPSRTGSPLVRIAHDGVAGVPAARVDYASLIAGLLDLAALEGLGSEHRREIARELQGHQLQQFPSVASGSGSDQTAPFLPAIVDDGAAPSGLSLTVDNLLRLDGEDGAMARVARAIARGQAGLLEENPEVATHLIMSLARGSGAAP